MNKARERRRNARYYVTWPVTLENVDTSQVIEGRGRNLGRGGALVELPYMAPVKVDQRFKATFKPRFNDMLASGVLKGIDQRQVRVVRVRPAPDISDGLQRVSLAFEE
ncbi:MAG: PilZ domain-containing protein [Phycisphaerae bacterium]|nr:PilZ domain-containing protein [Phycisphaerae bacterium]